MSKKPGTSARNLHPPIFMNVLQGLHSLHHHPYHIEPNSRSSKVCISTSVSMVLPLSCLGCLGQSPWPPCTENAIGTDCDWTTTPAGCCTAPNGAPAIISCTETIGFPNGTLAYEQCPTGASNCCWSQDTGLCCSSLDGQQNGAGAYCIYGGQ
jgi:hypothetical protein